MSAEVINGLVTNAMWTVETCQFGRACIHNKVVSRNIHL